MDVRALFFSAIVLSSSAAAAGEPAITRTNWRTHPRIEAVRAIYARDG
jgi:hypothetical protein